MVQVRKGFGLFPRTETYWIFEKQYLSVSRPLLRLFPIFDGWSEPTDAFSFGDKKFLNYQGKPVFAEIYVVRLLQEHDWHGVWVSSFGQKFLEDMPIDAKLSNHIPFQPDKKAILDKIAPSFGFSRGEVVTLFSVNASR